MNQENEKHEIRHDGIAHHPLGAASYYFRDDIVDWLCSQISRTQINLFVGAQPNSSPHMGNLINIGTAFAIARKLQDKGKSTCVYFDAVDTAPAPGCDIKLDNITYSKSLRWTGALTGFIDEFHEILGSFSRTSNIKCVKRRQEDILSSNEACRGLREIILRRAELGVLFSPRTGSLGLRATCPQAGCGLAEKFGLQNRYFEDSIEFKCPNHGPYSLCISVPSDLKKLELNTPLRNLLRNHIFHSDVKAHWIQIIGADYAGTYQEQFLWRPLVRNPGGNEPMIIYSPQILDWSGAKLSKSLYVQPGAYDYLRGTKLEYMLAYNLFRSSGRSLDLIYHICADWVENPYKLFRSYTIYHIDAIFAEETATSEEKHRNSTDVKVSQNVIS